MKYSRLKKAVHVMFYGNPRQTDNGVEYEVQVFPNESSFGAGVMQRWVMSPSFERPAGGNPINIEDPQYEQYIADNLVEIRNYSYKPSKKQAAAPYEIKVTQVGFLDWTWEVPELGLSGTAASGAEAKAEAWKSMDYDPFQDPDNFIASISIGRKKKADNTETCPYCGCSNYEHQGLVNTCYVCGQEFQSIYPETTASVKIANLTIDVMQHNPDLFEVSWIDESNPSNAGSGLFRTQQEVDEYIEEKKRLYASRKATDNYGFEPEDYAFPLGSRVAHIMSGKLGTIVGGVGPWDHVTVQWDDGTTETVDIYLLTSNSAAIEINSNKKSVQKKTASAKPQIFMMGDRVKNIYTGDLGTVSNPQANAGGMVSVLWDKAGGFQIARADVIEKVASFKPKREAESFNTWFDRFLDEKGLNNIYQSWEISDSSGFTHFIDSEVVIEAIKGAPPHEQSGIKDMIVKIDFMNGDVMDYFKHLAQALVSNF